jgi:carnitine-CoA ligase
VTGAPGVEVPGDVLLNTDELLDGDTSKVAKHEAVTPDDIAIVIWTGGTTGPSKGAAGSHQYMATMARLQAYMSGFGRDDVFLQPTPLFHTTALMSTLVTPILVGATGALEPRFSATTFWDSARKYGATVSTLFGALYLMLWNQPERSDDADNPVRVAVGAPVPAEIHREFETRFGLRIVTAYGLSECVAPLTSTFEDPSPPGYSGRESPTVQVALLDDEGYEVPDGEVGELCVRPRGPGRMFSGYFNDPQATVDATKGLWFHTGDLLRKGDGGWFQFVDRKQDYIRRRGVNISSFEVEQAILKLASVADVAVHGVPSDLSEEDVKACVVLLPESKFDFVAFMDHCVVELPYYAVPRYVEVLDALPRNAVGRVTKFALRDRGINGSWDRERAGYTVHRPT